MISLYDIELPPHYGLSLDADGLTLLKPGGEVLHHYGPAYSPLAVQDDAWTHALWIDTTVAELDGLLGRGDGRPSVHDLLCEALDSTGWTGAEKQAFLESFHAASQREERDIQRRFGVSG